VNQLAAARRTVLTQEFGVAAQLLGANERIEAGNEVGVFVAGGTAGSVDGGAAVRVGLPGGFSLLGGIAGASEDYSHVKTGATVMLGGALRYIDDAAGTWRPYVEVGAWGVPDATFRFSRTYMNGAGVAVGEASESADKFYVYGRAGVVFAPDEGDEGAISAEVGHAALRTGPFAETFSAVDPFEAAGGAASDRLSVAKVRAQWTHALSETLEFTVWGAGAYGFDASTGLVAVVDGIGRVAPTRQGQPAWAEYGARLGLKIGPTTTIGVFADGVSGDQGVGTDVRIGAGLKFGF